MGRPQGVGDAWIRDPGAGEDRSPGEEAALFEEYRRNGDRRVRNRIVESHMDVAEHHVARFSRSSGVSADDLRQTALLAMIRSVDRFDPAFGTSFRTFASRTIEGELKRFLRDRTWAVRPPRRVQELHLRTRQAAEELTHRFGRPPTVGEVAAELGVDVSSVLHAMEAGHARRASGLEASPTGGDGSCVPLRELGSPDPGYANVEDRAVLRAAVAHLDDRERQVLRLRFVEELTQPEIAQRVGLSQSYVSRLLRGGIEHLRSDLSVGGSESGQCDGGPVRPVRGRQPRQRECHSERERIRAKL